jgi:lipoprotein-anchoring transpeptidase ErfK/SrfK
MGAHRWRGGLRRPLAARVAVVAGLAVAAGSVVFGVGFAAPAPTPAPPAPGLATPATGLERLRADLPVLGSDRDAPSGRPAVAPAAEVPVDSPSGGARATTSAPRAAAPASTSAARPAVDGLVAGTPCTATARACVDISTRTAWLLDGDRIVRGPVRVQHGDREDPTPLGTFTVQWKAEQYTSREYGSPMPYSVFFAPGGVAFHEGRQDTPSAGCVKLVHEDAVAWFAYLQVGDEVQIH